MRTILFNDFNWEVKNSSSISVGPGPNYFSSSEENVYVDTEGLHLKTTFRDGKYNCAEVILDKPLGYGVYKFGLENNLSSLDKNAVFSGFLYESDSREIDIEYSWSMVGKSKGQYVIQPGKKSINVFKFKRSSSAYLFHVITWNKEYIKFECFESTNIYGEDAIKINEFLYIGYDNPPPDKARMIFNLWLFKGKTPKKVDSVNIINFTFEEEMN